MVTPADIAGIAKLPDYDRGRQFRHWGDVINDVSYSVAGSACVIWLGDYEPKGQRPTFFDQAGYLVDAKRWIARKDIRVWRGRQPFWRNTCGNGRCVAPEHIRLAKSSQCESGEAA